MAGQRDMVALTPATDRVRECRSEALGGVVVIPIADEGGFVIRKIPKQLGEMVEEVLTVSSLECFGEVGRERKDDVTVVVGAGEMGFLHELRLICEDRRTDVAEISADFLEVSLMGGPDELLDRGR